MTRDITEGKMLIKLIKTICEEGSVHFMSPRVMEL